MNIPRAVLAFFLLFGPAVASAAETAPDWVLQGTYTEKGALFAVGIGMSRVDALAAALGELAGERKPAADRKAKPAAEDTQIVEAAFGAAQVSVRSGNQMKDAVQIVTKDVSVALRSGKKRLLIVLKMKSETEGDMSKSIIFTDVEVHARDLPVSALIDELKKQGIEVRRWVDPSDDTEFVGLSVKAS